MKNSRSEAWWAVSLNVGWKLPSNVLEHNISDGTCTQNMIIWCHGNIWLFDVADCLASESKFFWLRGSHPPGLLATTNTDQILATRFITSDSYDLTLWSLIKRGTRLFLMRFTFCTFIDFLIANKRYIFLVKLSNTHCVYKVKRDQRVRKRINFIKTLRRRE